MSSPDYEYSDDGDDYYDDEEMIDGTQDSGQYLSRHRRVQRALTLDKTQMMPWR